MAFRALTFDRKLFPTVDRVRMWLSAARLGQWRESLGVFCAPGGYSTADSRDVWLSRPQAELLNQTAVNRRTMNGLPVTELGQGVKAYG